MRTLILVAMLAGVAGCGIGGSTGPDSTAITVRLRDDNGAPVDRTQVSVTLSTSRVVARTQGDGTADIALTDAGVYQVSVIPREGYITSAGLSKSVTVVANAKASVEFTVFRSGSSTAGTVPGTSPDW